MTHFSLHFQWVTAVATRVPPYDTQKKIEKGEMCVS